MKKIYVSIILCLLSLCLYGQYSNDFLKKHEFSLGAGYIQTMNTSNLPYGMSATNNLLFDYQYIKYRQTNKYFKYYLKGQFVLFKREDMFYATSLSYSIPRFYNTELKTGGIWSKKFSETKNNINLYYGIGGALTYMLTYCYQENPNAMFHNFGDTNWYISPDLYFSADYQLGKIIFRGNVSLPFLMFGNFRNQFHSNEPKSVKEAFKSYIVPNKFTACHQIFNPNIEISAIFPVITKDNRKLYFQLKYSFESLDIHFKDFIEKKEQHDLKLGLIFQIQ